MCVKQGPSTCIVLKQRRMARLASALIASSIVLDFILLSLGFPYWYWGGTTDLVYQSTGELELSLPYYMNRAFQEGENPLNLSMCCPGGCE